MIDWTKPVRHVETKEPWRVLCTDRPRPYELVLLMNSVGDTLCVSADGKVGANSIAFENIPERREAWVNIYRRPPSSPEAHVHFTREEADNRAGRSRIACIRIEYEEGEGL
jgi:hypothetical protein